MLSICLVINWMHFNHIFQLLESASASIHRSQKNVKIRIISVCREIITFAMHHAVLWVNSEQAICRWRFANSIWFHIYARNSFEINSWNMRAIRNIVTHFACAFGLSVCIVVRHAVYARIAFCLCVSFGIAFTLMRSTQELMISEYSIHWIRMNERRVGKLPRFNDLINDCNNIVATETMIIIITWPQFRLQSTHLWAANDWEGGEF